MSAHRGTDTLFRFTVAVTGTWSADGITYDGNRFSLSTYSRYASVAEFMAERTRQAAEPKNHVSHAVLAPGAIVVRFDGAPNYGAAVDAAYKGPALDCKLPAGTVERFMGERSAYDPSNPPRSLDNVSLDIYVLEMARYGIPVQPAAFAYVETPEVK